jgi:hypothetical protein
MYAFHNPQLAQLARIADAHEVQMNFLTAAWQRNKGAIASIAGKVISGNIVGAVGEVANDARKEAGRAIARLNAPPEAKATLLASAENAINVGQAAAGGGAPSTLYPLGAQGTQVVAIGGKTVSVNTLALIGIAVVLFVVVFFVARKRK